MNIERQYIGARYVPILGGTWDRNKSYEALTIVQANNSSYTSKKPVPPGIEISNEEYWVLTGNFNGQVEEYRQQVVGVEKELEAIKSSVDMKGFTSRTFVFYGDSYQEGIGGSGQSWLEKLVQNTGLTSDHYYNIYKGGYGFVGVAGNYESLIRESLSTISEDKRNLVTDVVISGGYNDWGASYRNLDSAIRTVSGILRENFKNAKYWLLPFAHCNNDKIDSVRGACTYWTQIGMKRGFAVPANCQAILANSKWMNTSDWLHPNDEGHEQLAEQVFNCLSTGSANIKILPTTSTFKSNTELFNEMTQNVNYSQDNGRIWQTSTSPLHLVAKDAVNGVTTICDGNHGIDLGSVTPIPFETFTSARTQSICVACTFYDMNETKKGWRTIMCTLGLTRGKLYAYPNFSESAGWITLKWKELFVPPFTLVPTTY